MRIVALALDTYGDHVLRQPLLSGLLDAGHAVTLVMRPRYADVVPYLDSRLAVIECDVDPSSRPQRDAAVWSTLQQALGRIRAAAPDLVVGLRYNRSAAEEWLFRGCTFSERLGFFPGAFPDSLVDGLDLPHGLEPPLPFSSTVTRAIDAPELSLEIAKNEILFRNITTSSDRLRLPRLAPRPEDRSAAEALIATTSVAGCRYIVLAPAGTSNNPLKQMPPMLASAAIEALSRKHGLATVITGVASERPHLDAVLHELEGQRDHVAQWIGATGSLGTLLGLLAGAEAYVGADLGTMHFAAAVGIPVVALFGGGHFPRFQPAATRWAGVTKRLPCFGCDWHCVFDAPRCIEEVSVATWVRAIDSVLAGQSPAWVFDPSGLDETSACAAQPEVARIRGVLRAVEDDRAERLTLLETQDSQLRGLQVRLDEVETDRKKRLDALLVADRELSRRQQAIDALTRGLSEGEAQLRSLFDERDALNRQVAELPAIERDRAERLALLVRQDAELTSLHVRIAEIEADRANRLALLNRQDEELRTFRAEVERDRAEQLALIERQDANLRTVQGRLDEVERDRAERLTLIELQHADLGRLRHLQAELSSSLENAESELAAQRALATSLGKSLDDTRAELAAARNEAGELRSRLARISARLSDLQTTHGAFRVIRNTLLRKPKPDEGGLDGP